MSDSLDQLAEQAARLLRSHGYGNLGRDLLAAIRRDSFQCKARHGGDPVEPQDCDWPHCGCDPAADKVLAALHEEGYLSPKEAQALREQLEQAQDRSVRFEQRLNESAGRIAGLEQERDALKASVLQIAANPPWEFYGMYDDERCFFCGQGRDIAEDPDGGHQIGCIWLTAQQIQAERSKRWRLCRHS